MSIRALLCIALLSVAAHAQTAATYVQGLGATTSTNSASVTFTNIASGSAILVDTDSYGNTTGTPSIVDAGCTWGKLAAWPIVWNGAHTDTVWLGQGCAAGSHTVTVSITGTTSSTSIMANVIANASFAEPTSGGVFINYSLTPTCSTVSATQAGELVISYIHGGAPSGVTPETSPIAMTTAATIPGDPSESSAWGTLQGPTSTYLTWSQSSGYQTFCNTVVIGGAAAATPTASLAAGTYNSNQTVTLSSTTPNAIIRYTLDSTTPSLTSPVYTGPLTLSKSTILTATAAATGLFPAYAAPINYVLYPGTLAGVTPGPLGSLNGWVPSPNDLMHMDVSGLAVDPQSTAITTGAADLNNKPLIFDNTIPYTVVDSTITPFQPFTYRNDDNYLNEGDNGYLPLPAYLPIEYSGSGTDPQNYCGTSYIGDNHVNILDRNTAAMYEIGYVHRCPTANPQYSGFIATIWPYGLASGGLRPYGFSSVDAAGLSVFEGLLRYDEIIAGAVNHAIRFTPFKTKPSPNNGYFVLPAVHAAESGVSGTYAMMGTRLRLKASFDVSSYSATNQIILNGMKKYGIIAADNAGDSSCSMCFQGTPDPRWNGNDLANLSNVKASNFEVVSMPSGNYYSSSNTSGTIYDSNNYPPGTTPTITSFTASPTTISFGQSTTLTWAVSSAASYVYIDKLGLVPNNGSATWTPLTSGSVPAVLTVNSHYLTGTPDPNNPGDNLRPIATVTVNVIAAILPGLFTGVSLQNVPHN